MSPLNVFSAMVASECMARAIVFDLDETLLDRRGSLDRYARCLWQAFAANAKLGEDNFGDVFHRLDGNGRVPRPEFFSALSDAAFDDVQADAIAAHFRSYAWLDPILFERVEEVIDTCKAHSYAVGLVTNGGSHSQNAKLANSGLRKHLDACIISEEFGVKKPDPGIYAEIANRLDAEPGSSWFVGDDPISDVCGPAAYGFNTAWIDRYLPWPASRKRCYKHRVSSVTEFASALFNDG